MESQKHSKQLKPTIPVKKIYIGPLDPSISVESLEAYFKNLELSFKPTKKKGDRSKNYITVTTSDDFTYRYLTVTKTTHEVDGLIFQTEEFLKGKAKLKKDIQEVKKKIYVGYIPKKMSEKEFGCLFQRFGSVKTAYINPNHKKGVKYGFIIFKKEKVAKKLVEMETIYFENEKMIVKEFTPKWTKISKRNVMELSEDQEKKNKTKLKKLAFEKKDEKSENILLNLLSGNLDFPTTPVTEEKTPKFSLGGLRNLKGLSGIKIKAFTPFEFKKESTSFKQRELLEFITKKHRMEGIDLRLNY